MKEIKAFIKPHKLDVVALALHHIEGLTGLSVSDVRGFGRGRGQTSPNHDQEEIHGFIDHVRLEILCLDELVEEIVSVIQDRAHTGLKGDGKIYVMPVETAVRVSTGERGERAV